MRSESKQSDYISDRICAGQRLKIRIGFKTKTEYKEKIKYATVAQLVEQTFAGETTAAGGR